MSSTAAAHSHSHSHAHHDDVEECESGNKYHSHSHHDHASNGDDGESRSLLVASSFHNNHTNNGGHDHHHDHNQTNMVLCRLKTASFLCVTFLLLEVMGGYLAGSLAILSDAAHLLADLCAFLVAIAASHLGNLPSTQQHTFGLKRMESLAALFSMVSLALVSVGLFLEAVHRILVPPSFPVDGPLMSTIATIGVVVNVILAIVLGEHHVHLPGDNNHGGACHSHGHEHSHSHSTTDGGGDCSSAHGSEESYGAVLQHNDELPPPQNKKHSHSTTTRNINLHAAYLHVLSDLLQSVAVLLAGLIIWWQPTWVWVDPIITLLFCALVFYSTLGVLRSSISVLLEEVPPHLNWSDIYTEFSNIEGVTNVHDLHVWSISHGIPTLSVHVMSESNSDFILQQIYQICQQHGIQHATVQVQCEGQECITCAEYPGRRRASQCHDAGV